MQNITHPTKQKHKNTQTIIRHDQKTGKFTKWQKKNKLKLTDSTYNKYKKEVLKK